MVHTREQKTPTTNTTKYDRRLIAIVGIAAAAVAVAFLSLSTSFNYMPYNTIKLKFFFSRKLSIWMKQPNTMIIIRMYS